MFKCPDKKSKSILLKLWNETQFSIWSQTAKNEANFLYQILSKYMEDFRDFQKKMDTSFEMIQSKSHSLPAFHIINEELQAGKFRVDKLLNEEAQITGKIIELLASFRKTLQFGEIKATKEYTQSVTEALSSPEYKLSQKRILNIHQSYVQADIEQKAMIKKSFFAHPFEKWYVDFSIRSEEFFRQVFSSLNIKEVQFQPYSPTIHQTNKKGPSVNQQNMPPQTESAQVYAESKIDDYQESEDDIVKQIFREFNGI